MVQYVKPDDLSENIIDYRIVRSPRGVLPGSAAAVSARKRADREAERQRLIAENRKRVAYMRWLAAARGSRGGP